MINYTEKKKTLRNTHSKPQVESSESSKRKPKDKKQSKATMNRSREKVEKDELSKPVRQSRRVKIDVSGKHGVDGRDGSQGSSGGYDGGDATKATPGEHAGDIDLNIKVVRREGDEDIVQLGGSKNTRQGESPIQEKMLPGDVLMLKAEGGTGGGGGDGGDGGRGRRGRDGSDATRYSWGTDGEDGGPGGDGGRASSGEDAGDGGEINVNLGLQDTDYLVMLDKPNVEAGKGGRRGRHGRGGAGGSGGRGGSSHSWTTYTYTTDSQGHRHTHPHFHSNPGGSSGSSGRSGHTPTGGLSDGADGKKGVFRYNVKNGEQGGQSYSDRYRVQQTKIKLRSKNEDGIIEPGEQVFVDIDVSNKGPMPTPVGGELELRLLPNRWVETDAESDRNLEHNIASGKGQKVSNLSFTTDKQEVVSEGERFSTTVSLKSEVESKRAKRVLPESRESTSFEITYPVEISEVKGDRTATYERPAKVHWQVKNISSKALGTQSESSRLVKSYLQRIGGDATTEMLTFTDSEGKTLPLAQGIGQAIAKLGGGETVDIQGSIGFKKGAPAYSKVKLGATLDLGRLNHGASAQRIQKQLFAVQLAQEYLTDPEAGLLLIVNNETSREEVAAWQKLAEEMGTQANVWNLSLYGAVSLTETIKDVKLSDDFRGKTAVFLNNDFKPKKGSSSPMQHLAGLETLRATVESNMSSFVVGGQVDINRRLYAVDSEVDAQHESISRYVKRVRQDKAAIRKRLHSDQVKVSVRWGLARKKLTQRAQELQALLDKIHPERRLRVESEYAPVESDSWLGWFKKKPLGSMKIVRGSDVTEHSVLHLQTNDLHQEAFIFGNRNRFALAKSLPFAQKLEVFHNTREKNARMHLILRKALLSDLAEEQQTLRQHYWNGGLSARDVREKLRRMRALLSHEGQPLEKDSAAWKDAAELVAQVRHMCSLATSFWDKVMPFNRDDRVSDEGNRLVKAYINEACVKADRKALWAQIGERQAELSARDKALKGKERVSMAHYLRPEDLWSPAMKSGFDAWAAAHSS